MIPIPGLDQIMQYLPYIIAGLSIVTAIAHRQGKSVPILSALVDILTGGKSPVVPVGPPVSPPVDPVAPNHPLLSEVLDLLRKALMLNQGK